MDAIFVCPREDVPPQNEPNKQPPLEGTGRDGTQTGDAAHIERQTPAKRAEETNKRDVGGSAASAEGDWLLALPTKLIPPRRGAQGEPITPASKAQAEPVVDQSTVAPAAPPPSAVATGAARPIQPKEVRTPQPPPSDQPAPQPPPAAQPPDPAVLARQQAELLDPAHPRDAMIYPKGVEAPKTTTFPKSWQYGKVELPKSRMGVR